MNFNERYFKQFLSLRQGDLTIIEYSDHFSKPQDVCGLDDNEEHDLTCFLMGLRSDILEKMNDCMTFHEAYFEAFVLSTCLSSLICEKLSLKEESHWLIANNKSLCCGTHSKGYPNWHWKAKARHKRFHNCIWPWTSFYGWYLATNTSSKRRRHGNWRIGNV